MTNQDKDMINSILQRVDDLPDDYEDMVVEGGIIISTEGLPSFVLKFSEQVTDITLTRDQLAAFIQGLVQSLYEMDERQGDDNKCS